MAPEEFDFNAVDEQDDLIDGGELGEGEDHLRQHTHLSERSTDVLDLRREIDPGDSVGDGQPEQFGPVRESAEYGRRSGFLLDGRPGDERFDGGPGHTGRRLDQAGDRSDEWPAVVTHLIDEEVDPDVLIGRRGRGGGGGRGRRRVGVVVVLVVERCGSRWLGRCFPPIRRRRRRPLPALPERFRIVLWS